MKLFERPWSEIDRERMWIASALMHAVLHPTRSALLCASPSERWAIAALAVQSCGASISYARPTEPIARAVEEAQPHVVIIDDARHARELNGRRVIFLGDDAPPAAMGWREAIELGRTRLSHYDKDIVARSKIRSLADAAAELEQRAEELERA